MAVIKLIFIVFVGCALIGHKASSPPTWGSSLLPLPMANWPIA